MRRMICLLVLLFMAVFACTVGSKLASKSRALMIGVVIGVVASVPAALLSVFMTAHAGGRQEMGPGPQISPRPAPQPPPVLIVNPGHGTRSARYAPYLDALVEPPQPRTFTVVGDDPT